MVVDGEEKHQNTYPAPADPERGQKKSLPAPESDARPLRTGSNEYRLEELAYLRSGDKGDTSNIGTHNNTHFEHISIK